jgi:hypothetical protein
MRTWIVLVIWLAASAAHAEDVGLVVTGDPQIQVTLAKHIEKWLKRHGHKLTDAPLAPDAINTLVDCLTIDDQPCARGVVDRRSKVGVVVFARIDASGGKGNLTLTTYWFVKGKNAISERRVCEKCGADELGGIADTMMAALRATEGVAKIKVSSDPAGVAVAIDDETIGTTPTEHMVSPGEHKLTLSYRGHKLATRSVAVAEGATELVDIPVGEQPSKIPGILAIAGGVATIATGGVMIYLGERSGADVKYVYDRSTTYIGAGLAGVGVAVVIGGGVLLNRASHRTIPVASIGSSGGYVGFAGRF